MVKKFGELFENVQLSKSILKKLNIPLDNEDYLTIRGMLEKVPGWVGVFTMFRFENNVPLDALAQLYDKLTEMQALLPRLPQPVDRYNNFEKLGDDLENLDAVHKGRKLIKELNKQQQAEFTRYNTIPQQRRLDELAREFYALPKSTQDGFTKKMRQLNGMTFVSELEGYIEGNKSGFTYDLIKAAVINQAGAEVIYENEDQNLLLVEIETYAASQVLSAATRWCIRNSSHNWDNYVGYNKNSRQYTIYDFSVRLGDNHSMTGVTIGYQRKGVGTNREWDDYDSIRASHWKNDDMAWEKDMAAYFGERWALLTPHMKGLDKKECDNRRRCVALLDTVNRCYTAYNLREAQKVEMRSELRETYDQLFADFRGKYTPVTVLRGFIRFNDSQSVKKVLAQEPQFKDPAYYNPATTAALSDGVNLFEIAVTEKAGKVIDLFIKGGLDEFNIHTIVPACEYFAERGQYERILALYPKYTTNAIPEKLYTILAETEDIAIYKQMLTAWETVPVRRAIVENLGKWAFEKLKTEDPEFYTLYKAAVVRISNMNRELTIAHVLAEYSDDTPRFLKEFEEAKSLPLCDNDDASVVTRLLQLGMYNDATRLIVSKKEQCDDRTFRSYTSWYLDAIVEREDYRSIHHLLKDGFFEFDTIIERGEVFPNLAALMTYLTEQKYRVPSLEFSRAVDMVVQSNPTSIHGFVRDMLPHKNELGSQHAGLFSLLTFAYEYDSTSLIEYFTKNIKDGYQYTTVLDESGLNLQMGLRNLYDDKIKKLYVDETVFDTEEYEVNTNSVRFDDLWSDVSPENLRRIESIVAKRGWVVSPTSFGVLQTLRQESSKGGWDDEEEGDNDAYDSNDRDDYDYDEEEEILVESKQGEGEALDDLIYAIQKATRDTYDADTRSSLFMQVVAPLQKLLGVPGNPIINLSNSVSLRLPLEWLKKYLEPEHAVSVQDNFYTPYHPLDVVLVILDGEDRLFDPDVSEPSLVSTEETFNECLAYELDALEAE